MSAAMQPKAMAAERVRAAAQELLAALQFAIRFHDQLTPADVARMQAAVNKATGSQA